MLFPQNNTRRNVHFNLLHTSIYKTTKAMGPAYSVLWIKQNQPSRDSLCISHKAKIESYSVASTN